MLNEKQNEIIKAWNSKQLSDEVALDEMLDTIKYSLPDLRQLIIDTDSDELTDSEALDILINVLYNLCIIG